MYKRAILLVFATLGTVAAADDLTHADPRKVYLFYLHGRIIEEAGPRPIDDAWGLYDYPAVVDAMGSRGAVVVSEQRPRDTNVAEYAAKVVSQIDALVQAGVPESQIAVVGFSKGGSIAMFASALPSNQHRDIKYVFLAACVEPLAERPRLSLKGHVLSIREASDDLTKSCRPVADYSGNLQSLSEMTIDTGAQHGAFYLPREEWTIPTLQWVHGGYQARGADP
jgi:hypothetical protein